MAMCLPLCLLLHYFFSSQFSHNSWVSFKFSNIPGGKDDDGGSIKSGLGSLSGSSGLSKKQRKARTAFTDHQLQTLEKSFERQKYLSVQDRMELANKLGLSDTQVKTWYQNRRWVFFCFFLSLFHSFFIYALRNWDVIYWKCVYTIKPRCRNHQFFAKSRTLTSNLQKNQQ